MTKGPDIEILYQIIDSLQKVNAPVSIKGGLVLKAILDQYNADIDRKTIEHAKTCEKHQSTSQ